MQIPTIAVVGGKSSGKTTAAEAIIKGLAEKGYLVAAVKHIPELDFTIDTVGKDTWRYAQVGAHIILSVAAKELTIIQKVDTTRISLDNIIRNCQEDVDVIVLEGFRKLVAQDPLVLKVVIAKTADEVLEASNFYKPILAFAGSASSIEILGSKIPYANPIKEPEKLAGIVDKRLRPVIEKRRELKLKETLKLQIDGKSISLNPFVQTMMRNVIFSMISTLKGVTLKGNEKILIDLTSPPQNQ
jgi:molybdopterin-guanine dinucleotide biosynthesis protein B